MKMEVTMKEDDKVADVVFETSQGTKKVNDYPLRLPWSKRLRNLKFTKTFERLLNYGIISELAIGIPLSDHGKKMKFFSYFRALSGYQQIRTYHGQCHLSNGNTILLDTDERTLWPNSLIRSIRQEGF